MFSSLKTWILLAKQQLLLTGNMNYKDYSNYMISSQFLLVRKANIIPTNQMTKPWLSKVQLLPKVTEQESGKTRIKIYGWIKEGRT